MKERPILFSGPMVRAILDGRKTQTRRVVKPYPKVVYGGVDSDGAILTARIFRGEDQRIHCPYGKIGERLWVRETWTPDHAAFYPNFPVVYRADRGYEYERNERGEVYSPEQKAFYPYRWRPSIHMPRWASRITLEITGLRVELLQDISEADAKAEGADPADDREVPLFTYTEAFQDLWKTINGSESWAENPWVWAIEFKVIK